MPKFIHLSAVLLAATLSACAAQPYVHHAGEFNREATGFGQEVTDISQAIVCYSPSSTTPEQVMDLAIEECGKFGHSARFEEQRYSDCPITTPVSAVYLCVHPNKNVIDARTDSSLPSGGGGYTVNYDGIPFSYGFGYTAVPLPAEPPAPQ